MINLGPGKGHVLVVGTTQSGKSKFVADKLLPCYPVWVVIDSKRQDNYWTGSGGYTVWTPEQLAQSLLSGHNKIHYAMRPLQWDRRVEEIDNIAEICLRAGPVALIIDEASHFMTGGFVPPNVEKFVTSSMGKGGTLIVTSQRPSTIINKTLVSQCLHIFMGYLCPREITPDLKRWLPVNHIPEWKSYQFMYTGPDGKAKHV